MPLKSLQSLDPKARELAAVSTAWMDSFWNGAAGLLIYPGYEDYARQPQAPRRMMVRDTVWYAAGLLLRRQGGDALRAVQAIESILEYQINEPGQVYHGTFLRYPDEPRPRPGAMGWRDYDPNWREFIITVLQILLIEFEPILPAELVVRIDAATRLAVDGALARGLHAAYTNIALMHAFMLCQAGERLHEPDWHERGEQMARDIYALFKENDAFEEYNSPTYYGTDLYALGLWRQYSCSALLRQLGNEMDALLWTDIARFYHAGLRNICGPFDRSYGMDMTRYAALTGMWIWLVAGKDRMPFPDPDLPFAHTPDFCMGPCAALVGAYPPVEALPHFLDFQGERQVEHGISSQPRRSASAWLEPALMIGAEFTGRAKKASSQFHPATIHWQAAPGQVGWLRLVHYEPVDATATRRQLHIQGSGEMIFQVCAPGARPELFQAGLWNLPGLQVHVTASPAGFQVEPGLEWVTVHYVPQVGEEILLALEVEPV